MPPLPALAPYGKALRRRLKSPDAAFVAALVVAVVLGMWMTVGAWGGRLLPGEDTAAHMVRARFASDHLMNHGRIDGWEPSFILGYQEFLFIGPLFTWTVVGLHWLSLGTVSLPGAFKVVVLASFVATPLSVAFFARAVGLSRLAAALGAIMTLAVNNPFGGVGLQGLFNVGLVVHQFATPFFFVALGSAVALLRQPSTKWAVIAVVSVGGLLLSHGISAAIFGVMLGLIIVIGVLGAELPDPDSDMRLAVRREVRSELVRIGVPDDRLPAGAEHDETRRGAPLSTRSLLALAVCLCVAALLAACVLLPFFGHRDLRGINANWGTPPIGQRLAQIWRGEFLFRPGIPALLLVGFLYCAFRAARGEAKALLIALLPLAYVIAVHAGLHLWPTNVIAGQLTNRGMGYAGALAVLPLAFLVARVAEPYQLVGWAVAVALALAFVILPLGQTRDLAHQLPEPISQLRTAAKLLHRVVPPGARFATQRDFPGEIQRTHIVNPDRWLAWASGRNTLNAFNPESSQGPTYETEHIVDRSPDTVADALSRLGTTHLVTVSDAAADRIGSSARFRTVWRSSPIAVFAVSSRDGQPPPESLVATNVPARARLVASSPEHLTVDLDTELPATVTVPFGWSPKWHARSSDGTWLPMRKSSDGLLQTYVPVGHTELHVDFRQDIWDRSGMAVSLLALLGCVAAMLWRDRVTAWARRYRAQLQKLWTTWWNEWFGGGITPPTGEAVTADDAPRLPFEAQPPADERIP